MKVVEEYFRLVQLEFSCTDFPVGSAAVEEGMLTEGSALASIHNALKKLSKARRRFASTGFLSLTQIED
jgi:hypothetical protein